MFSTTPLTTEAPGRVMFLGREDAEALSPSSAAHLLSISDSEEDQAQIDESRWASVSYHHFLDQGYDEELVDACGADFEAVYKSCFLPDDARAMRERIFALVEAGASLIVVNCQAGRSRSAAVARYIHERHNYELDQSAPDANLTVYRLLSQDPSLMLSCRMAIELSDQPPNRQSWLAKLVRWFGFDHDRRLN